MNVRMALSGYKESDGYLSLSDGSKRAYGFAEKYLTDFLSREIGDITRGDIVRWSESQTRRGSARLASVLLKNVMQWAYDRDLGPHPISTKIKSKRQESHKRWTMEEFDIFCRHAPESVRRLVTLALYTGQRKSDVIRMRWSDYDGQVIKVVQKKTGKALAIPVHARLRAELDAEYTNANKRADRSKNDHGKEGYILRNNRCAPWNEESARRAVSRVCDECLPERRTLHGLRHTAASLLAELGLAPSDIAAITGHTSLKEVARYTVGAEQIRMAERAVRAWEKK